ncbi:MAG: hypothetical protein LBH48_07095 [Bifidobacteriaceae bacterium]|jgi:DNA-binding response OmpR family regulator|nr:hypothetical protein [Bifidobacteriaceae bacterium]
MIMPRVPGSRVGVLGGTIARMTQDLTNSPARDAATRVAQVLLYSDNATIRRAVTAAVGERLGRAGPAIEWTETATHQVAMDKLTFGFYDLLIADAETGKLGGIGLARFVADEVEDPPPVLMLITRPQDRWLATWSGAARTLIYPTDPFEVGQTVSEMLGEHV